MYPQVAEMLSKSISATFRAQGRPRWKKRNAVYEWPILYMTGRMRARAEREALGPWVVSGQKHTLYVWSTYYGQYHQYGTKYLPERKFVKPTKDERVKMRNRIRHEWNLK
jgi:phage gpG-like protein